MELKITISWLAHAKIKHWMQIADKLEVSGFGKILKFENQLHVSDVFLIKQKNGGASTDIDADDLSKVMYETRGIAGDLNFWWHSHHTMGAYFSKTDTDTIEQFGKNGYLLATCFDSFGKSVTGLYLNSPTKMFIEDLQLQVTTPLLPEMMKKEADDLYLDKVTEQKWVSPHTNFTKKKKKKAIFTYDKENKTWRPKYEEDANRLLRRAWGSHGDDIDLLDLGSDDEDDVPSEKELKNALQDFYEGFRN